MRDAKVEEVEHISDDSDEDTRDDTQNQAKLTVAIFPQHQVSVFYFFFNTRFIYFYNVGKCKKQRFYVFSTRPK